MNLLFDNIIFSKERQGGISKYWSELIGHYANDNCAAFYEEDSARGNIYRHDLHLHNLVSHAKLPDLVARMMPIRYITKDERLLYHSSFYRKLITKAQVCEVATVHDFIHDYYFPLHKKVLHNYLKYASIRRAKGLICVSENTRKDLLKFCRKKKEQEITVIHNGVGDEYMLLDTENPLCQDAFRTLNIGEEKFILFVGSRASYKNFDFACQLLSELKNYKLVVVGNPLTDDEKRKVGAELIKRIIVAENISNLVLNLLYNKAHALLYPSNYEGFGIPVIEAMTAGCPVLALNRSSIPEIAGEAGILFNTLDIHAFKRKIMQLESETYRDEVIKAGMENAKRFSWKKCVEETKSFYESIY